MPSTPATRPHSDAIDGVRALAALSVLAFHVWLYRDDRPVGDDRGLLDRVLFEANIGLIAFFVLSGFLLYRGHAKAAATGGAAPPVGAYAVRRAARIVPAYWLCGAGCVVLYLLIGPREILPSPGELTLFAVFAQNYSLDTLMQLNPVLWTLSVEVAFYVALPLLGWVALRLGTRGHVAFLLGLVAVTMLWRWLDQSQGWGEIPGKTLPAWLGHFAVGMLGAVWLAHRPRGFSRAATAGLVLAGLAIVVAQGVWHQEQLGSPELRATVALLVSGVGFALIIAAASAGTGPAVAWLRARPLAAAGLVSYGVYLWHLPLVLVLREADLLPTALAPRMAVVLAVTLAVAAFSWHVVERPVLQRARSGWVPRPRMLAIARKITAARAALVCLAIGWALLMQSLGWAQTSYYVAVKALGDGTTQIDEYHWETRDKSYTGGHFYSVKAPGLPLLLTPPFLALDAAGAQDLARRAADAARRGGARQWTYRGLNVHAYGGDPRRAAAIKRRLETQAPMVWALGLVGSVLPALLLLVVVRRLVERVEPGLGTLTAVTLGMATLVMPFAAQLFGHILATLLGFAAFVLVWRERDGERSRPGLLVLAGLLAGLAVTVEYPLALAGAIVGVYALGERFGARHRSVRGAAYAGGVVAGVMPLLLFNLIAFGSVTTLTYDNAVNEQGRTGHATLGLNDGGFFGIDVPDLRSVLDLLLSPRGALVVMPVVVMALVGTWLLNRRGRRAEAAVIAAVTAVYFVYDAGYWLPMGGGSPGPRFLIPVLPFLAIGLACAWRRFPGPTLALAVPGAVTMIVATVTYPLVSFGGTEQWMERAQDANFQHTLLSVLGRDNGWVAVAPVLLAFGLAAGLAARATGPLAVRAQWRAASLTLAGWGLLAGVAAPAVGEAVIEGRLVGPSGYVEHAAHESLVLLGVIVGGLAIAVAAWRSPQAEDDERPDRPDRQPEPLERPLPPRRPRAVPEPVGMQHHGPQAESA